MFFFTYSIICIAYKYKPIPLTVFLLCQTAVCFYRFFSSRKFFLFCNKTVGLCIVHMNGWKDSCFVKGNNAKPITNQTIYEILWCITLYHTRRAFFSRARPFSKKTLKIRVATSRKRVIDAFFACLAKKAPQINICGAFFLCFWKTFTCFQKCLSSYALSQPELLRASQHRSS